ncbi:MAG: PmbA/TldA family metallopeptidase, partial [Thermoleophilaceae bacterium]
MRDLLEDLMDAAARRADYADARFVRTRSERLSTRNGSLDRLDSGESEGIGVRVRVGGAWGFCAARGTARADAEAALA